MPSQNVYSVSSIGRFMVEIGRNRVTKKLWAHALCEISVDFDENGTNGLHLNQIMGKCIDPLISRHRRHFEILYCALPFIRFLSSSFPNLTTAADEANKAKRTAFETSFINND